MPELRNCWMSEGVKVSGCANICAWREGLMANGLSMSMTVVRPTSSTARDEYSAFESAKRRYRPLLRKGAAMAPAAALDLIASRRVIRRAIGWRSLILCRSFHGTFSIFGAEHVLAH